MTLMFGRMVVLLLMWSLVLRLLSSRRWCILDHVLMTLEESVDGSTSDDAWS